MGFKILSVSFCVWVIFFITSTLCADVVAMQNGDRYYGTVMSVSPDTVILKSDVLGKIALPRKSVASLIFGTNSVAPTEATNFVHVFTPTNLPTANLAALTDTNVDLAVALHNLGSNTNFIQQIRNQMLAGSPEATGKFDEMVSGLMSGTVNIDDLRREAKASADQIRELKSDLGPDVGDSLDDYLQVLDQFVNETNPGQTNAAAALHP
jgi:hypothetical protein